MIREGHIPVERWRQTAEGWEFLGSDGNWYLGHGAEEERETIWRQTASGRWQYQAADGNWYFGGPGVQPVVPDE